ncbi:FCD domain-containing protein [Afifella sp. IM 167]|uniref:FCD domain-containing protein n=1 Tax=Afifella sp. IM 167 TaxID=2033586 RepID=UPI001CCDBF58|nr:FCD domain-containing protein [Afifella sp. IM 167]MBZ8135136.1 GntR family transcriptional regulator [Afifella sp. IM 167]
MKTGTQFVLKRDRLSDQIAENLEEMIFSGELSVGDALPSERDLMQRYGVGRPAVREALLWLNKKGLVAVSNGERTRVTEPNPTDLLEQLSGAARMMASRPEGMQLFQQTRLFAEVALAREAAMNASPQDLETLGECMARNRAARNDIADFARTDDEFHFAIASISRNPLITALYNSVLGLLQDQRHTSLQNLEALDAAIECHQRIFDAIAAGKPDEAEVAMRKHLKDVENFYWKVRAEKKKEGRQSP